MKLALVGRIDTLPVVLMFVVNPLVELVLKPIELAFMFTAEVDAAIETPSTVTAF